MKKIITPLLILSLVWVYLSYPIKTRAAFSYYRTITVNASQVPSAQSNFPMLVAGTYTYLKTIGNGGSVQDANGYDVGFYSSADCSTGKLAWETELYTASSGVVVYWVKVASIADGTVIYMCYGNAGISTDQSNPTAVWDADYKVVYHLPNGTTLSKAESTTHGQTLNQTGTPTAQAGKIDGGVGTSDGNSLSKTIDTTIGTTNTVSAWVNGTTWGTQHHIMTVTGGAEILTGNSDPSNAGKLSVYGSDFVFGSTLATGTWYYVTITRNGTNTDGYIAYLNGVVDITTTRGFADSGAGLVIGTSGASDPLDGKVDEVRVSGIVRAPNWITTEYNNQSAPGSFYAVGNELTPPNFVPKIAISGPIQIGGAIKI